MKMTKADAKILEGIYDALGGVASEMGVEFFDSFYKGGGKKMCLDFEGLLNRYCGIKFVEPEYKAMPMAAERGDGPNGEDYFFRGKWMIVDQTGAMVLTGLDSKEEAEKVIKDIIGQAA